MARHLWGTAGTEVVSLCLGALVLPVAARAWDPAEFGRYSLTYRLLALLHPALTLSANVSTTRHLARLGRTDRTAMSSVIVAGARMLVGIHIVVFVILLAMSGPIAKVVYGGAQHRVFIACLAVLATGATANVLVAGSLRGTFRIGLANLLGLLYTGIVPLLAISVFGSAPSVLIATGILWAVSSIAIWSTVLARPDHLLVRRAGKAMRQFGWPRVPGELASFGLMALPPLLVAGRTSVAEAGYVSLGLSIVTVAGVSASPLSSVLLPHLSDEFAGRPGARLETVRRLVLVTSGVALVATAAGIALMPTLVRVAFGRDYSPGVGSLRIACLAIPGYVAYVGSRSILDAYHERAVTMRYAVVGFSIFVAVTCTLRVIGTDHSELVGFAVGMTALAALTLQRCRDLLSKPQATADSD
jgi:O-antigen/teichoic acid export membrane protein